MEGNTMTAFLENEKAIKLVKDSFEKELARGLSLTRVSSPTFMFSESGLNGMTDGSDGAVSFNISATEKEVELLQSLAKWNRVTLAKYGFQPDTGIFSEIKALYRGASPDETHSVVEDKWEWEKVITEEERKSWYLKRTAKSMYKILKRVAKSVSAKYPEYSYDLPEELTFFSAKELDKLYPTLSMKEREDKLAKKYGAVFIIGLGWKLSDGKPHAERSADCDDWKLNGDMIFNLDKAGSSIVVSSIGIRVDKDSLFKQLKAKKETERLSESYLGAITENKLPLTIGGEVVQSKLCAFLLNKSHIGEVQYSVWSEEAVKENGSKGVNIL